MIFSASSRRIRVFYLMVLPIALFLLVRPMPAHAQNIEWESQIGTSNEDEVTAVATSPSSIYVTGGHSRNIPRGVPARWHKRS